jgi:hypothetical protein
MTLKKLSYDFQTFREVAQVIEEIRDEMFESKKWQLKRRILGHLISFTEHQFGDQIPEKIYRKMGNGEHGCFDPYSPRISYHLSE